MIKEYYIISEESRIGPYDLIAVVKKIRNGSIDTNTQIELLGHGEPLPASEFPEFADFFVEENEVDNYSAAVVFVPKKIDINAVLSSGFYFLQKVPASTIFSGAFVLISILFLLMINQLPEIAKIIACIPLVSALYLIFSLYEMSILRMSRGQPADTDYVIKKSMPIIGKLIKMSFIISLPLILAFIFITVGEGLLINISVLLLVAIGLFCMTVYSFVPFLIVDQNYDLLEAMAASNKAIFKGGIDNFAVLLTLNAINFISGTLFILPLTISLPITICAIAEIYDEMF